MRIAENRLRSVVMESINCDMEENMWTESKENYLIYR